MFIFALKKIESVVGKQVFYDLVINGINQQDQFNKTIANNPQLQAEKRVILSYMNCISNLQLLPKNKFRDITPKKDDSKEYEIKTKHLRVYLFHLEKSGKIAALWGFKTSQKSDIERFRKMKNDYFNQQ
jgi:hypothetical protein